MEAKLSLRWDAGRGRIFSNRSNIQQIMWCHLSWFQYLVIIFWKLNKNHEKNEGNPSTVVPYAPQKNSIFFWEGREALCIYDMIMNKQNERRISDIECQISTAYCIRFNDILTILFPNERPTTDAIASNSRGVINQIFLDQFVVATLLFWLAFVLFAPTTGLDADMVVRRTLLLGGTSCY